MTKKWKAEVGDILEALPETSEVDTIAQRRARASTLDLERVSRIARALRQPGYEELARRPITLGEPFAL